ncbi:MAG TPA: CDP-alcohol phosphatidyltransferase family protein [Solirubrobacteraceae bacterium]|nr:CDP-alcohol phosphatidyltransferase family protein [Solirubrobacteraceae bacterium]
MHQALRRPHTDIAGARTRRWAASGAHVSSEAVEEVPYDAAASGATLAGDAVSAGDAIIFLARRPSARPSSGRSLCHPSPIAPADQITSPPPVHPDDDVPPRPARPSVDEVRAAGQPPGLLDRAEEQWAGRLYMRRLSPHVTRALLRTPVTPNAVTWLMIATGLLAALVLTLPGLVPAIAAVVLIQVQLLCDCVDGELARWYRRRSPVGVYLDKIAHYATETTIPVALGIRADGGFGEIGTWTVWGLVAAMLIALVKAEASLVDVARAEAGLPPVRHVPAVRAPRSAGLRRLRRIVVAVPFFRAFIAVEASLLALAAAVADEAAGDLAGTRVLVAALVAAGAVTAAGHLVAILASDRLR